MNTTPTSSHAMLVSFALMPLSKHMRFIAVLAEASEPIPLSVISARSGLPVSDLSKIATKLTRAKRVSRRKPKLIDGGGYYRYWLTKRQRQDFINRSHSTKDHVEPKFMSEIAKKVTFLKAVGDRTIYGDSPIMQSIIDDYKCILRIEDLRELSND